MRIQTRIIRTSRWETTEKTKANYEEYCKECREFNEKAVGFMEWVKGFIDEYGDDYGELTSEWGCALKWVNDDEDIREVTFTK